VITNGSDRIQAIVIQDELVQHLTNSGVAGSEGISQMVLFHSPEQVGQIIAPKHVLIPEITAKEQLTKTSMPEGVVWEESHSLFIGRYAEVK